MIEDIFDEIGELWENRHRIWVLTKTDLKMEYALSKLGFFWSLLEPAGIILIYSIIFPMLLGMDFYSWVLFFIAGFIPHRYLQDGIISISQSLVDKRNYLNEMNIKEEIVPISTALTSTIKFLLECTVFFSIIFFSGLLPTSLIIIFPLLVAINFFMVLGFGMHLAVSYIDLRDLDHILNVFFQALMFLTPIIYRIKTIPEFARGIYLLNPQSRLILLYQGSVLSSLDEFVHYIPVFPNLLLMILFSLSVLFIGYLSFKRRKKKYIGEI